MSDNSTRPSRRSVLRVAALGGAAAIAGCSLFGDDGDRTPGPDERGTDRHPGGKTPVGTQTGQYSEFETVVDVREELGGADGRSVNGLFDDAAGDDTLFVFPDGRYELGRLTLTGLRNFAIRAAEGASPVLTPEQPASEIGPILVQMTDMERTTIQGLTFDFREEGDGGIFYLMGHGDFTVRDLTVEGPYPKDVSGFRFEVTSADHTGVVENVNVTGGSMDDSDSVGLYVGRNHAGTLVFRDCVVENFPNNGLYASSPGREDAYTGANGPVHVEGGRYKNNNIANVRLGSTGSTAKGVHVVVDEEPPSHRLGVNARGIRLRARGEHRIENCRIEIGADAATGFGGLVLHSDAESATVRDTTIVVDREEVHAVNAMQPSNSSGSITLEGVEISGGAAGSTAVNVTNRDGLSLTGCRIEQSGNDRDGIRVEDTQECVVTDTEVTVTGEPLVSVNSEVARNASVFRRIGNP